MSSFQTASKAGANKAPSSFPSKITKTCTLVQLRDEASFRGLDLGTVPLSKSILLEILGEGSTSAKAAAAKLAKQAKTDIKAKNHSSGGTSEKTSSTSLKTTKKSSADTSKKSSAFSVDSKATAPKPKKAAPNTVAAAISAVAKAPKASKKPTAEGGTGKPKKPAKTAVKKIEAAATGTTTAKEQDVAAIALPLTTRAPNAAKPSQSASNFAVVAGSSSKQAPSSASSKKRKETPYVRLTATKVARRWGDSVPPAVVSSSSFTVNTAVNNTTNGDKIVAPAAEASRSVAMSNNMKTPPAQQPKPKEVPRISKKLTMQQLKEEAIARQIHSKNSIPKTKADLLHFLVDGSIHVAETPIYKTYKSLMERVENEKQGLYHKSLANRQAEERKKEERQRLQYEKAQDKSKAEALEHRLQYENAQEKRKAATLENRNQEKAQASLHQHCQAHVHSHSLALTKDLMSNGRRPTCDICKRCIFRQSDMGFTCEQCNWDICADCFKLKSMTPQELRAYRLQKENEQRAYRLQKENEQREHQKRFEEMEKQLIKREQEEELRWNAEKQFKAAIITPGAINKDVDAKGHKFVVWCSDGYGNDGWHSYNPPPTQHFDTIWKTAKDANDRARYLFFWKNSYGLYAQEFSDECVGVSEPTFRDGLVTYSVAPEDSTCWTVGVVPTAAFRHLPQASTERHNHDRSY